LAAFDADGDRSVFDADEAAAAPVFFEFPTWARSEAAALFAAFDADGERSVFAAAEAAALPVFLSATINLLLLRTWTPPVKRRNSVGRTGSTGWRIHTASWEPLAP
jgi:L-rhamnose isomerase